MRDEERRAELARLKDEGLTGFLEEISRCGRGDISTSSVMGSLITSYRALYGSFRFVDEEDLAGSEVFDESDVQLVDYLGLGQRYAGHFYRKVVPCLSETGPETSQKVVRMLRSTDGHTMAHGLDLGPSQVPDLFGEEGFAGEVAEKLKTEMRAEELGRILGYAISGLWEEHGPKWREDAAVREEHGNRVDLYLQDVIRESDKAALFAFEQRNDHYAAAMKIWSDPIPPERRERGEGVVEHCFIGVNNYINIGASFSQDYEKTIHFVEAILAADALTRAETIQGKPNPYWGFKVQPYCYMTGYPDLFDYSGELLDAVAQAPLMALFSHKNPSPLVAKALVNLFPVVAGSGISD
ncbi:MAG: hypothetical protein ACXIUZ_00630 [Lysobacteraceae bacterium]